MKKPRKKGRIFDHDKKYYLKLREPTKLKEEEESVTKQPVTKEPIIKLKPKSKSIIKFCSYTPKMNTYINMDRRYLVITSINQITDGYSKSLTFKDKETCLEFLDNLMKLITKEYNITYYEDSENKKSIKIVHRDNIMPKFIEIIKTENPDKFRNI